MWTTGKTEHLSSGVIKPPFPYLRSMGTRRGGGSSGLWSSPGKGGRKLGTLKKQLEDNAAARIAVNTAVGYVAASNPAVGSVVAAYKIGKSAQSIARAYGKAKRKTGSTKRAREAAVGAAKREVRKEIKSAAIDAAVNKVIPPLGDRNATNLARSLAKSVAKEAASS